MELLWLHYFRELANQEHLTNTANRLLVSPSSLSATISKLEQELGVTLFDRVGRRIVLNECGRAYLKYVNAALNLLEDAPRELADISASKGSSLSVGVTMPSLWGKLFSQFCGLYPEITFSFKQFKLSELQNKDIIGKYDLFIAEEEDFQISSDWDYHRLGFLEEDEQICFAVPPSHPMATREIVTFDEVKDQEILIFPPDYAARRSVERTYASFGCTPKINMVYDHSFGTYVTGQAAKGRLLTSALRHTSKYQDWSFLRISDPTPPTFNYAIGWQRDRYHSRASTLFREFIINCCPEKN